MDKDEAQRAWREARFEAERQQYNLVFRCSACVHVKPSTRECTLGYPNPYLRGPLRALEDGGAAVSCKYFELGETIHPDPWIPE